jgi:hypothetical protein
MPDFDWIFNYGYLGSRVFDLANFMICAVVVLLFGQKLRVSALTQLILILHCFLPFILNDVLFPTSYMPDQFRYWRAFNFIRSGEFELVTQYEPSKTVLIPSYFFSLIPLPIAAGPWSLGFYNAFLYILLFFWLYNKKVFTSVSLAFFLFFPSFALYSSLALRETLIIFFMIISIQLARENRKLLMLFSLIPLYFIKFQNFFIILPLLIVYVVFSVFKKGMTLGSFFIVTIVGCISIVAVAPAVLPLINMFRKAMFVEDGGDADGISEITTLSEFFTEALTAAPYFLTKPFIWEASNALQLIQSIENLVVLIFLVIITRQAWRNQPKKLIFWMLFLSVSMTIYGIVVANYGTAVRYRYPFIVAFVLFVCADCNIQQLFPTKKFTFMKRRLRESRES